LVRKSHDVVNEIRKLFTINYLDPNAIRILYGSGRAVITGEICRLPGYDSPIRPRTLAMLELDLTNLREIRFIRWGLTNWINEGGEWRPIEKKKRV